MTTEKDNGGPAFPFATVDGHLCIGMTLRDYFASNAPTDEVQELYFRHLSRDAQERLTGMKYPEDRRGNGSGREENSAFQLAEFAFKCAVNAAIRYALATAMLKQRTKDHP